MSREYFKRITLKTALAIGALAIAGCSPYSASYPENLIPPKPSRFKSDKDGWGASSLGDRIIRVYPTEQSPAQKGTLLKTLPSVVDAIQAQCGESKVVAIDGDDRITQPLVISIQTQALSVDCINRLAALNEVSH